MNRRNFIKAAIAGLAALVLPKGKAEAPAPTYSGYTWWKRDSTSGEWSLCNAEEPSPEIISLPDGTKLTMTATDGHGPFVMLDDPDRYAGGSFGDFSDGGEDHLTTWTGLEWGSLETHSTIRPLFATDDMIADWEAMGWKPEG